MGIVYKATNLKNGKCYIGKTKQPLNKRIYQHFYYFNKDEYVSLFHKAIKKYGKDCFSWDVLYEGDDYSRKEFEYIAKYGDYNIVKLGANWAFPDYKPKIRTNTQSIGTYRYVKGFLKYDENHPRYIELSSIVVEEFLNGLSGEKIRKKYNIGYPFYSRILKDNGIDSKLNLKRYLKNRQNDWELKREEKQKLYDTGVKRKNKRIKENGSINVGMNHPMWKGYWITPMGKYERLLEASTNMNISPNTLSKICKSPNSPLSLSMTRIGWFKMNNININQKPIDLGFGFQPAEKK